MTRDRSRGREGRVYSFQAFGGYLFKGKEEVEAQSTMLTNSWIGLNAGGQCGCMHGWQEMGGMACAYDLEDSSAAL